MGREPPAVMAYHAAAVATALPDGTSSHDLRHHYASVLLAAGESVHAVAERLGDTPQMVLSVYGHVMPDQEYRTRRAVDAAWQPGEPRNQPGPFAVPDRYGQLRDSVAEQS